MNQWRHSTDPSSLWDNSAAGYTTPPAENDTSGAGAGRGRRPKSLEAVIDFFHSVGGSSDNAKKFYLYHEANGWTEGLGNRDWGWDVIENRLEVAPVIVSAPSERNDGQEGVHLWLFAEELMDVLDVIFDGE